MTAQDRSHAVPCLALLESVLYPRMVVPYFVGRPRSKAAIERALETTRELVVLCQRDPTVNDPGQSDLFSVGTLAVIMQMLLLPDGLMKILVEGTRKVRVRSIDDARRWLLAGIEFVDETPVDTDEGSRLEQEVLAKLHGRYEAERRAFERSMQAARSSADARALTDALVPLLFSGGSPTLASWRSGDTEQCLRDVAGHLENEIQQKIPDPLYVDPRSESRVRRLLDLFVPELLASLAPASRLSGYPAAVSLEVRSYVLAAMIPGPAQQKQELLELPDGLARLAHLSRVLETGPCPAPAVR
ncbi:MAG: LON peptidase substrate-binding domain-containing protein [Candidatus Riflebacteria bacterium]|nr:LON peptidase substrate-binding domain-containing protein [Candidatus Riflebacteria bacterium]